MLLSDQRSVEAVTQVGRIKRSAAPAVRSPREITDAGTSSLRLLVAGLLAGSGLGNKVGRNKLRAVTAIGLVGRAAIAPSGTLFMICFSSRGSVGGKNRGQRPSADDLSRPVRLNKHYLAPLAKKTNR